MPDMQYKDLYEKKCRLKNLSETTIKGYGFTNKYFLNYAGDELTCNEVTQDLINGYILHLKDRVKPETVNSVSSK